MCCKQSSANTIKTTINYNHSFWDYVCFNLMEGLEGIAGDLVVVEAEAAGGEKETGLAITVDNQVIYLVFF